MADLNKVMLNSTMKMGSIDIEEEELAKAKKELESWKIKVEKADDNKARLILEKLGADDIKSKAQKELNTLSSKSKQSAIQFDESTGRIKDEILKLERGNQNLKLKLKKNQADLESKRAEAIKLQQRFKICAQIPKTKVKFVKQEKEEVDRADHIKGVFTITQRPTLLLEGGQALITFEEEKVSSQILRMAKCSVSCETTKLDVKPKRLALEPSVKFEVHIDISKKELTFSNAPPAMPEERMRDRLELSFSKPSRGGGEVERVDYDKHTGSGQITFLQTGVAEHLALRGKYCVNLVSEVNVKVAPVYDYRLRKFQTFCGVPKRTILLEGIADVGDEEDLQDHLEIHFQKPSNYGGEVESIKYVSKSSRSLHAFFTEDTTQMEALCTALNVVKLHDN